MALSGEPPQRPDAARQAATIAGLTRMLEAGSRALDAADLTGALDAIARTLGEVLHLNVIVVNLYRPAWDDFVVVAVHGPDEARRALLGSCYPAESWNAMLDERFLRHGAYMIPAGTFDFTVDEHGDRYVPDYTPVDDHTAWQPEDELFVPFHGDDGALLGIFSVGEPESGLRPSDAELDVVVAMANLAARSVQAAQEAAAAADHRRMLERLLAVSSKLMAEPSSTDAILNAITDGISAALRFERVAVQLPEREGGLLVPYATSGWTLDDESIRLRLTIDDAAALFDEAFEIEGCYLVPVEEAAARIPMRETIYHSVKNGRGPHAWNRHWLVVPLVMSDGERVGLIWADEPTDRLLPSRERLQALRVFADQAATALRAARAFAQLRHLADRDPLTHLLNRRAFHERLNRALAGRAERPRWLSLVFCDLDRFKELNDAYGHAAGDAALGAFAAALRAAVRDGDEVFRIGGDEFALVLDDCSGDEAGRVIARVRGALARDGGPGLAASFGVATLAPRDEGHGSDALLRDADAAMYGAKRRRRGDRPAA